MEDLQDHYAYHSISFFGYFTPDMSRCVVSGAIPLLYNTTCDAKSLKGYGEIPISRWVLNILISTQLRIL
jgi:hypothetical protein